MAEWRCQVCGYVVKDEVPEKCPLCQEESSAFLEVED